MNIYLDIDGVLLTDSLNDRGNPTPHSFELLKFLTDNHKVYWLTTHCHGGENRAPEHLYPKFPPEAISYIDKILPTNWGSWKTDAIDFNQDFRWLDDDVYRPEYEALAKNGCSEKLIKIDLNKNPLRLQRLVSTLKILNNPASDDFYPFITPELLEHSKLNMPNWPFKIEKFESQLQEIALYIYTGTLITCEDGLYDFRREIMQTIIDKKLREFNSPTLTKLLEEHNIKFQLSDFMIEAIHDFPKPSNPGIINA